MLKPKIRTGPRHPRIAGAGYEFTRWISESAMERRGLHKANSDFAKQTLASIRERLLRGESVYIAGLACPGTHNTGVALVEVTQSGGPRLIINNEEERFSGNKHTNAFPEASLNDMRKVLRRMGRDIGDVAAFVTTWDYSALLAMLIRTSIEEAPASLKLLRAPIAPAINLRQMDQVRRLSRKLGGMFGLAGPLPLICLPHHDNHAWYSFAASPFADAQEPIAIAVLDGTGDIGSISLYVAENGEMKRLYCNESLFDSLGAFYTVISSSQGGWTWLSSEGRYMGAAAWGDMNRATNPYYKRLKEVLQLGPNGEVRLNRAMANWHSDPADKPYKPLLIEILGPPLRPDQLWNPDAMLRVEDIHHRPDTKDRLDKAAATQMVFEDAMIHVVDHLLRITGTNRLVLTGGVALNALGNMRLLEHFDEAWFEKAQGRKTRLHMWVPPVPGDPGVPIGAAWLFAHMAGAPRGAALSHAFYCGLPPTHADITAALQAEDVASTAIGNVSSPEGRDAIADLMAYMVAQGGVIAIYQGAAETGPRALGHRSILANPCDPNVRERLNERVKYREAIRPLAPMATLEAALDYFQLEDGASDADYNAYNYMVLTAHSKPQAREKIPAVVHADGTGRIQIVRAQDDPLTYAYLKALGRHIGVEMSVNTSFNVAGPIAQTPAQAIDTLRRSKGLDAVVLVADDGTAYAAWHGGERDSGRFTGWYAAWTSAQR
ncbi:carbamoyltransferase C-terminal domain-containing protein [Bradyrhizobium lablabi]|uniref:carbamoyltransferase C-terminal domain-containing protein n=1 Tax=Bradyrhizobium lablabi TaxID=722472 RepID=UPI001BABC510|nr:carbamoyltransferase C-terminal domain-containing protein [Bradyrhizobium lablabi]MBR0692985.1 carbamoyltransferase [Bradyrhizobium lablabi]